MSSGQPASPLTVPLSLDHNGWFFVDLEESTH